MACWRIYGGPETQSVIEEEPVSVVRIHRKSKRSCCHSLGKRCWERQQVGKGELKITLRDSEILTLSIGFILWLVGLGELSRKFCCPNIDGRWGATDIQSRPSWDLVPRALGDLSATMSSCARWWARENLYCWPDWVSAQNQTHSPKRIWPRLTSKQKWDNPPFRQEL